MPIPKLTALAGVVMMLGGCATQNAIDQGSGQALALSAEPSLERLLIATTRARAEDPNALFSGERSTELDHAAVTVSIPPGHQTGQLESPRFGKRSAASHFVVRDRAYLDTNEAFIAAVNAQLSGRAPDERDVLLFVHGYNNAFEDSVFRFSQFAHDSGFSGIRVLFSWASRGSSLEYFYDRESATIARDGLERTLRLLAGTKARKIHIMAHSMGNWVAMESLRQLQISGNATLNGKVGEVILASPDIDADVFKAQMRRLGRPAKPYNLVVSRDDRALDLSQRLSGNLPRIGNYTDDAEITGLGIIVYDATDVKSGDKLRHGKFADAPEIVQLLGRRLREGSNLAKNDVRFSDRLQTFGRSLGGVVTSTGGLIISAPQTVLTRPHQILTAPVEILGKTVKPNRCSAC